MIFIGADAYMAVVTASEYVSREDLYIVYAADGEDLKSKQEGGWGPYQFVAVGDSFSQRWCKYLAEVRIEQ